MTRQLILGSVLAATLLAGLAWATGWLSVSAQDNRSAAARKTPAATPAFRTNEPGDLGEPLRSTVATAIPMPASQTAPRHKRSRQPIVIANCRTSLLDTVEVPAAREGVLAFLATDLQPGEQVSPDDIIEHSHDGIVQRYRRLKEGDWLEKGQLLALVDDRLARAEVQAKQAKLKASVADKKAALDSRNETEQRYLTQKKLYDQSGGVTSLEEYRGAYATWLRYISEAVSKEEAVHVAQAELHQAETTLAMYAIRSPLAGQVKKLYKHRAEAVKNLEPVLQLESYRRLRVEGLVDLQHARSLQGIQEVIVEPTLRDSALRTFLGHGQLVTGVAFAKEADDATLVTSSDDGTVRVWKLGQDQEVMILQHAGVAVRAVACTPPGAQSQLGKQSNLCLSGDAAGRVRLWDLDTQEDSRVPLREMKGRHQRGVRCVAFSPDGAWCASGGEDHEVMLWDTATGELVYHLDGHRDVVTAVQFFVAKDSSLHLLSVSDDLVQSWKLGSKAAEKEQQRVRRTSQVAQLGASSDGGLLMEEHGAEIQIVSLATSRKQYLLRNTSKANSFKTMALFSPNTQLALTTSGAQDYLQLWKLGRPRSHECRQLMTGDPSAITCAAFDPQGRYVVAGLKDAKVCAWQLPSEQELSQEIRATVNTVEQAVESVQNQVRLIAEVDNSQRLLTAGDIVTLVAYPNK